MFAGDKHADVRRSDDLLRTREALGRDDVRFRKVERQCLLVRVEDEPSARTCNDTENATHRFDPARCGVGSGILGGGVWPRIVVGGLWALIGADVRRIARARGDAGRERE